MHKTRTMKKILISLIVILFSTRAEAQTFAEWFQQKKTQKEYLLQQIAALKVYYGYVKKGYEISEKGLKLIGDIKDGDLNLHTTYFQSLEEVNPEIRDHPKVDGIIALQLNIVDTYKSVYSGIIESGAFNSEELNYIERVFNRLLDDCADKIDALTILTSAGKLQMKDDERLAGINTLYLDMQDNYIFARTFGSEAIALAAGRLQEKNNLQTSLILNGIENQ
jgi:hypothetical protein